MKFQALSLRIYFPLVFRPEAMFTDLEETVYPVLLIIRTILDIVLHLAAYKSLLYLKTVFPFSLHVYTDTCMCI